MKVILLEDMAEIGRSGDVVEVSDGFARNVLFPSGKAAVATSGRVAEAHQARAKAAKKSAQELAALQRLVEAIDRKTVTTRVGAGPQGKLHGAVTADDVARVITQTFGVRLPKESVRLAEPIKEAGSHRLTLEFPHGLEADVTVVVEAKPTTAERST